jgi:hypothetical protein
VSVLVLLTGLVLLLRMRRRRAGRHVASREVRTLRVQVRTLEAALAALAEEKAAEIVPEEESVPEQGVDPQAGHPGPEAVEPLPDEVMNKCVDRVRLSLHGLVDRIGGDEAALLVLARVDAAVARLATTPAIQRPALAPAPSAVPAAAPGAASPAAASSAAFPATGPVPATPQAAQPPVPPVNGDPDRVLPIPAPSAPTPSQGRRWFRRSAARNAARNAA